MEAHQFANEMLNKARFEDLIANENWEELSGDIKRIYSKVNLLASFEMIKLSDAFKQPQAQKPLCLSFYNLIHGTDSVSKRIDKAQFAFAPYEMDKWPIITYPLFIIFPEKFMFVKPTVTKEAAENRRFDIKYDSKVNSETYKQIMIFSQDLFDLLSSDPRVELHPVDMIDVQGFMWCTFAGGWTDKDFKLAKKK